jgi:hypothetical protein
MQTARVILPFLLLAGGCGGRSTSDTISVVDFIREVDRADRRPLSYAAASWGAGVSQLPAIVGPAPGRLTWTLLMPRGARFRARAAALGAPVRVRVGISDNRVYEGLSEATLTPSASWTPIDVDLSDYAGWKLSLFYRPERVEWHFILNADAVSGVPGTVAWGLPEIVASRSSALEYADRRARLIRSAAP